MEKKGVMNHKNVYEIRRSQHKCQPEDPEELAKLIELDLRFGMDHVEEMEAVDFKVYYEDESPSPGSQTPSYELIDLWFGRTKGKEKDVMDHKKLYASRRSQPWVDKHRPEQLDDVKHQGQAVQKLIKTIRSNKSHIYLYGKPGIGKTSTVLAVAKHIFRCPVLNESSDTPVHTLLKRIKNAEADSSGHNWRSPSMLILIDRAQHMGEDYQKALIRTMRTASFRNFRFIFKCDCMNPCKFIGQDNRLIGPLAEVCVSIGFKSLPGKYVESRLWGICSEESLDVDPKAISEICRYANGSLGLAITLLQRAARSFRSKIYADDLAINEDKHIPVLAMRLINVCKSKQWFLSAENAILSVENAINIIIEEDRDIPMYLSKLYDVVVKVEDISDIVRNRVCDYLVEADKRLHLGENGRRVVLDVAGTVMIALLEISDDDLVWLIWLRWKSRYPEIDTDDCYHKFALEEHIYPGMGLIAGLRCG